MKLKRQQWLTWPVIAGMAVTLAVMAAGMAHIMKVREPTTFFDYFVLDIVFLPLQVILVSVILERLLHGRERQAMFEKLNMVVGAFFTEVGYDLLRQITGFCDQDRQLRDRFNASARWNRKDYEAARLEAVSCKFSPDPAPEQLERLRDFLEQNLMFNLSCSRTPTCSNTKGSPTCSGPSPT